MSTDGSDTADGTARREFTLKGAQIIKYRTIRRRAAYSAHNVAAGMLTSALWTALCMAAKAAMRLTGH